MNSLKTCAVLLGVALVCSPVRAQVPVTASSKTMAELVSSPDKTLAANKTLVVNLFREVLEGRHIDLADKYLATDFIQHNPNASNGLQAVKEYFSRQGTPPRQIRPTLERPVVALVAEGDLVMLVYAREVAEPKDPSKKYTTTGFDMYRIHGKVVEHWDGATKATGLTGATGAAGGPPVESTPVTVDPTPAETLAKSSDGKRAANKALIVNMWRELIEARQATLIDKYFSPAFVQHAPTMVSGLDGIRNMLSRGQPQPVEPTLRRKVTAIIAEGDIVVVASPRELPDPKDQSKRYTTTAIEMYRIENAKIAEHWDANTKPAT
jgi:predicted SnoaL-like aldol condensation-catalyzing enzyme